MKATPKNTHTNLALIKQLRSEVLIDLNTVFRRLWMPPDQWQSSLFFVTGLNSVPGSKSRYLGLDFVQVNPHRSQWHDVLEGHYQEYMKGAAADNIGGIQDDIEKGLELLSKLPSGTIDHSKLEAVNKSYHTLTRRKCTQKQFCDAFRTLLSILSKCEFSENLLSTFLTSGKKSDFFYQKKLSELMEPARQNVINDPFQLLGLLCENVIAPGAGLICISLDTWRKDRTALLAYMWGTKEIVKHAFSTLPNHEGLRSVLHLISCKLAISEALMFAHETDLIMQLNPKIKKSRKQRLQEVRHLLKDTYGIAIQGIPSIRLFDPNKDAIKINSKRVGANPSANSILDQLTIRYLMASLRKSGF